MSALVNINCETCGKSISKYVRRDRKRNNHNYCNRDCYNARRKEGLKRIKRHTTYFTDLVVKGCECGVTEYYLLQIHHKDGDTNNNHPDNLEVVCANCHIKRHLKINKDGKLVYHRKTLTSPEIFNLL